MDDPASLQPMVSHPHELLLKKERQVSHRVIRGTRELRFLWYLRCLCVKRLCRIRD